MVWMGDIDIPWITSKDTSISKDVVEKNFVDNPPTIFEKTAGVESGSYTFILNEEVHQRSEIFEEQIDAVESMPSRHGVEFPFKLLGDQGHIIVDTATVSITPSQTFREAEVDLRFMEKSDYQPAFKAQAGAFNDSYDLTPVKSTVAIPDTVSGVEDSTGSISPEYYVDTEDGKLDLYLYDDVEDVIQYLRPSDYTSGERIGVCRLYTVNDLRIYSTSKPIGTGSYLSNSYIRPTFDSSQTDVEIYDVFQGWQSMGSVNMSAGDGYASTNTNYEIEVDFIDSFNAQIYRGKPAIRFDFTGETKFEFTANDTLSFIEDLGHYAAVENEDGKDIFIAKATTDGSFSNDSSHLTLSGLDDSKSYTVWFGVKPARTFTNTFVRRLFNQDKLERTFIQK